MKLFIEFSEYNKAILKSMKFDFEIIELKEMSFQAISRIIMSCCSLDTATSGSIELKLNDSSSFMFLL